MHLSSQQFFGRSEDRWTVSKPGNPAHEGLLAEPGDLAIGVAARGTPQQTSQQPLRASLEATLLKFYLTPISRRTKEANVVYKK